MYRIIGKRVDRRGNRNEEQEGKEEEENKDSRARTTIAIVFVAKSLIANVPILLKMSRDELTLSLLIEYLL